MRIAITGARGFIARNLLVRLSELGHDDLGAISHDASKQAMADGLAGADIVFHLAGVNRPDAPGEFETGNRGFSEQLCEMLAEVAPKAAIIFASSTQAALDNDYGRSKRAAENVLAAHGRAHGATVSICRLTNVFGKWARPNYNSAVATFCHNIARGLPITILDPRSPLRLVYVDDVIARFVEMLRPESRVDGLNEVGPEYESTVGEVAALLGSFRDSRASLLSPRVGTGFVRALYSTYVSYLPTDAFAYDVPMYTDPRGTFAEMLKTPDCGQFSFFTAHPGVTRGEHYHHSKTEKFLVIKGRAAFGFRHIETGERHSIETSGDKAQIVETVPGWTHNITNIGNDEMVVMLWANEIFDRERPDTIAMKVDA